MAHLAGSARGVTCFATQVQRFFRTQIESDADGCMLRDVMTQALRSQGNVRATFIAPLMHHSATLYTPSL